MVALRSQGFLCIVRQAIAHGECCDVNRVGSGVSVKNYNAIQISRDGGKVFS